MLDVGDGNAVYWETCGKPQGKPALVLHGGPGSGCTPWHRRLFDPARYRIVLFDQRNCGRSLPHASDPAVDLVHNTTQHLMADIELLREHLGIEQWLVLGGSWGSTLALSYAEAHPDRVSEMILFGVTTGRHSEIDWLFRGGISILFPVEWERLFDAMPPDMRDDDILGAYHRLVNDPDTVVRDRAAEAWCMWESATPDWPPKTGLAERFNDQKFALGFARLVTHYMSNNVFLEDGVLLRNADQLAGIPGVLVNGRFDLQAPLANAWALHGVWPSAELVVVENAGHAASNADVKREIISATNAFAREPSQ